MQVKPLKELIKDLEKELLRLCYTQGSMNYYRNRWMKLIRFSEEKGDIYYTEKLGIEFVERYFHILEKDFDGTLTQAEVQNLRIIRMIGDYQLHHTILRRYYKHNEINTDPYSIAINKRFNQYCIEKGYSPVSIEHYVKQTARFLDYAVSQGLKSSIELTLPLINEYIKTLAGYSYKTIEQVLCSLRSFLKFLYLNEETHTDFSTKIPMIQARKQTRIPSVWEAGDLKKLINAIDRGSPLGKRDYAIILLACRVGLRCSDIKKLTLDNFHWS